MLENGQNLLHFKIIRKLGEGGMGEVYLAEDQKLNRQVAIKILQPEFFDSEERMQRFTREARMAAKITHPNVTSIYDLDKATDEKTGRELLFIVMEYVKGDSLSTVIRNKSMNISELLRISEKIAAGLSAAHKLQIVHRDIKTDNIKIDEDGEPKILDFGLAKPLEMAVQGSDPDSTDTISQELTQEGKIIGTVNYMSPEQARGKAVDARSDVFSFGTLMYKLFSGEFPFEGSDQVSILAKTLEAKQAPIREKNESLPPELERIIDKCLQKDPNDRYQDTRDLVVDLRSLRRQYDSGVSDSISGISDSVIITKKVSSGFIKKAGITVVALVAAAILIYFLGGRKDQEQNLQAKENSLAILGFENKTGDASLDWLRSGLPEILMTDLAQGGTLNLISRSRVLDCLDEKDRSETGSPSHQACMKAAKSIGATRVLSGSYIKLGDQIRIDARVEDVETGQIILGEKAVGDNPIALVDSLTRKIAQALNLEGVINNDKQVADITSSSPEAYREYILGMEKFGQFRFDEANEYFERAIEIDSTFALPYMRIGMGYAMRARGQMSVPYLQLAKKYENKLPIKDKRLLDIYTDIWMNNKFDDAIVKTQSFIENYPDDKEVRGFYALLLNVLKRDPEAALKQLDTVLMLDPQYMLAFSWYVDIYRSMRNYDKAIEYAKKIKEYYPDAPESYISLASLYLMQSRLDEATAECKAVLEMDPENQAAVSLALRIAIQKRDFDEARKYAELIKKYHSDDHYSMVNYYDYLRNFAYWTGRFKDVRGILDKALDQALQSSDSAVIFSKYSNLSNYFENIGNIDSALYFGKMSSYYASNFQSLAYPIQMVSLNPLSGAMARDIFKEAVNDFKSKTPKEIWVLVDNLEKIFEGYAQSDTALLIEGFKGVLFEDGQISNTASTGDLMSLGMLLVENGKYKEGKDVLEQVISGDNETSSGLRYLKAKYYIGRADEALGNTAEAADNYREVLKYWNKPQIEIKEIKDTRKRLAALTS